MGSTTTYVAEIEDPVTGERLVFEAATESELDDLMDRRLDVVSAEALLTDRRAPDQSPEPS